MKKGKEKKEKNGNSVVPEQGDLSAFSLPPYREIPDVGLFLEQTSKYISGCLEAQTGLSLTPFMISNYVKQKLIGHPVKKQYSRDQIAVLFVISLLKTVLSLDEIRLLLDATGINEETAAVYETVNVFLSDALIRVLGGDPAKTAEPDGGTKEQDAAGRATALLRETLLTVAHKLALSRSFARF